MVFACKIEDSLAVMTLDRESVHNVINDEVMSAWEQALDELDDHDVRLIIVTGAGTRTFCAGGDLKYFATLEDDEAVRGMSERMQRLMDRLYRGHRPVIAAVNGSAYGGGCEILSACHLRIAHDQCTFQFRQASMGVVTGWGGGRRVLAQLGRRQALELLLTGDRIDATTALRIGLVDHVVSQDRQMDAALALAERILARSPEAVANFMKLAMHDGDLASLETDLFVEGWRGDWFQNAMSAFLK